MKCLRWMLALLVVGGTAWAQRVRVAVHPLSAPGIDDLALVQELDDEIRDILSQTERITAVNADDVMDALAAEGGKCSARADERVACLERLALATRAEYSLAVELKKLGGTYQLSAVMAAANGAPLQQPEVLPTTPSAETGVDALLKSQLRRLLLERMRLAEGPPVPLNERTSAISPVEPSPPPEPLAPSLTVRGDGFSNQRFAGRLLVLGGAAAAVGGLIALGLGAGDANQLQPDARGYLPPEQVQLYQQAKTRLAVGETLVGGGLAAAAAGGLIFVLFRQHVAIEVASAPTVGGVAAMVSGAF